MKTARNDCDRGQSPLSSGNGRDRERQRRSKLYILTGEHILIVECFPSRTGRLRSGRLIDAVNEEHVVKQPHKLCQRIAIYRLIAEIEFSHILHNSLVLGTGVSVI